MGTVQRQRAGRTEQVYVRLTPEEMRLVIQIADERQASNASVIRWALHKALQGASLGVQADDGPLYDAPAAARK